MSCRLHSVAGHFEGGLRQPLALNLDARERRRNVLQIARRKRLVYSAKVLFQPMQPGRAGNGHDPRLLCQQPCERDPRGSSFLFLSDFAEEIDEGCAILADVLRTASQEGTK